MERRKSLRHPVGYLCWLHAHDENGFFSIGQIVDLNFTGVSYRYIFEGKDHPPFVEADLLSGSSRVKGIPCTLIYEHLLESPPYSRSITVRCGLRFSDLTKEHDRMLWIFMSNQWLHSRLET